MKFSKGQKIWSIIAAVVAMSAVGIFIIKPGKKKKAISTPPVKPADTNDLTTGGDRIQSVTTNATNVNLRSSASSATKSNIIATVAEKGKYIGNVIEYVSDDDGGDFSWVHIQPQLPFNVLDKDFYVRSDLISTS